MLKCFTDKKDHTLPISLIATKDFESWRKNQDKYTQNWLSNIQYRPKPGAILLIPDAHGALANVLVSCAFDAKNEWINPWSAGGLPNQLPEGNYYFANVDQNEDLHALAWALGAYQFDRYKKSKREPARLLLSKQLLNSDLIEIAQSIYCVRDLINTPANDLGPTALAAASQKIAREFDADYHEIIGNNLIKQNYPGIYTVGQAAGDAPRLIDFKWGNPKHPKITLVGKGVCFDSGGLDLKPAPFMTLMKKDMGGAAHVLGLARLIMARNLPLRLRVLIPAVENSVSGNAYHPGDIIKSRSGLTIEVGNTDAEGRIVLADALTEAADEKPDLIIDISTLTGAARVALGPDLPVFFANDDEIANDIIAAGLKVNDPVWQLPLFEQYRDYIQSPIADINNNSPEPYAGAITAALFLQSFVPHHIPWLHFDIMAWNIRARLGRPVGGEAMGLRALYRYLQTIFCR